MTTALRSGTQRRRVDASLGLRLCRTIVLLPLLASGTSAKADESPPAAIAPGPTVDEAEILRAMQADQSARAKTPAGVPPQPEAPSAPTPAAPDPAPAGGRSFQTMNPDLSAIVDLAGGWFSDDAGTIKSGDDPQSTGIKAQEIEVALQQVVDPYFRADIFLTIPNLSGLEVEEAFLTTTQLPANFQIKAGVFRAGLGRQNGQHLHLQDFSRRPDLNAALLGTDGLRAPGVEVNYLVPALPFYLVLSGEAFSVGAPDADVPLQTFGGGNRSDLSYVTYARAFFPLSEATSLYLGLNYARGKTAQTVSDPTLATVTDAAGHTAYDGHGDNLYGTDIYMKWKPANQAQTYASVAWQTEYFVRQIPHLVMAGVDRSQTEGGLYSQVVVQTHRRWFLGLRGEVMGLPSGDNIRRDYVGALSLTWALSEFARVRLYGETRRGFRFLPLGPAPAETRTAGAVFLQVEAAIGAHGAHPF